jgi:hypothetical protein
MLAGNRAGMDSAELSEPVRGWLTGNGCYRDASAGWVCGEHRTHER